MADKKYFKLAGIATNFTDMTQPDPSLRSLSNRMVKPLAETKRVRDAVRAGALQEAKESEYKAFIKENEAERNAAADRQAKKRAKALEGEMSAVKRAATAQVEEVSKQLLESKNQISEQGEQIKKLTAMLEASGDAKVLQEKEAEIEKLKAELEAKGEGDKDANPDPNAGTNGQAAATADAAKADTTKSNK